MNEDDLFESSVGTLGDRAGVFEFDGDVANFYLAEVAASQTAGILGVIRVSTGVLSFSTSDLQIKWGREEDFVGLFIRGENEAAFDLTASKAYGGDLQIIGDNRSDGREVVPPDITLAFA